MRNRPLLAIVALLASGSSLFADLVITQKVEGAGQVGDVVVKIKGDKIRADLPKDVSSITDTATGEVINLMHAQKSYLRISPEQARAMLERMQQRVANAQGVPTGPAKLQPANRKEKVGEWDTEVFTTKIGSLEITYWVAKDFPNYAQVNESMMKIQQASLGGLNKGFAPSPQDFPGMPVKTEMSMGGDKKKITSTILSVKEEPVDASVFELPKDYKEIELRQRAPAAEQK